MALVFNAGTDKAVTFIKGMFVKFYDSNWDMRDAYYPIDTQVPFNIMPFVIAYRDDSSQSFVELFRTGNAADDLKYGLHFTRQNDVIKVAFGRKYYNTITDSDVFASFEIGTFPSAYNIYFFYAPAADNSNTSFAYCACQTVRIRGVASIRYGSSTPAIYRIGQSAAWDAQFTEVGVGNAIPLPYPTNTMANDTSYLDYFPSTGKILYGPTENSVGFNVSRGIQGLTYTSSGNDLDSLVDAQGEAPTPPVPPEPVDPNDEGEPADEGGGDGDHTPDYDPVPVPTTPTQGAATAGFVTMYKLHQAIMSQFASDCFASNLWEAFKLYFSNPMDFLVGVNLLPFEPTGGNSYKPKYGAISFAHAYPTVANQYFDVDCGSVNVNKYWGSCFDYEPYTKIQIWLPYIGYRDLPVDEIMDMTVSVKYRCDCLTGDCVAFVYTGVVGHTGPQVERIIGQFYGNCAVRVPFSGVSYDSAISNSIALMGAAASAGVSAGAGVAEAAGKVGGEISGLEAAGRELATNTSSIGMVQGMKPNIHKGGAAGASTGYMSVQVPYLIRRIPRQNLPSNYMHLKGYPSNIGGKLSDFTGLAIVDDIQLNDIPAMEDERKEILQWLRGGVLI